MLSEMLCCLRPTMRKRLIQMTRVKKIGPREEENATDVNNGPGGDGKGEERETRRTVDLTSCTPKAPGRSIVWQENLFALNPVGDAVCTTCQVLVPRSTTTRKSRANTSNLVAHYRNYHSEKLAEAYQTRESKMKQRDGKAKQATLDIVNKSREERLMEGIADFVIVDQQPLSVVEEQTFRRLLCIAGNKDDLKLPGRRALRALILARKESVVRTLKENVPKGLTVTAISDIWTANIGVPYINLTAHWIEMAAEQWTLKKVTVGCEAFGGSHTVTRIQQKSEHMADVVGTKGNIVSMITDTAANIKRRLTTGLAWNGLDVRLM
ncbi:unnamed protein product [Discosporangium mesarthrocarpum]